MKRKQQLLSVFQHHDAIKTAHKKLKMIDFLFILELTDSIQTSVVMAFFFAGRLSLMVVMPSSFVTNSVSYAATPPAGFATTSADSPPSAATRELMRSQYCCLASS